MVLTDSALPRVQKRKQKSLKLAQESLSKYGLLLMAEAALTVLVDHSFFMASD